MSLLSRITGATLEIGVTDMTSSRRFYDRVLGAEPDLVIDDDLQEYQPHPGLWLQLSVQDAPSPSSRLRFGVIDIAEARADLSDLGVAVGEIESVPGLISWCDFDDPDGNPLGLYQELS
ncbi:VOC family protein [Amnibacterium flavum]|uniref:Glyoxalase n=1 Tax=Amnibacterium flavum TaxID=2173173 RepID=A0A2V1HNL3_9MICO|nr:hypothetical protein [Amnibacterium flavum]PVZ94223.1 hypothetical protein DDQ50_10800 [Amnibacterium flavum]